MVYTITSTATDFNKPVIRGYIRRQGATSTKIYIDAQDDTLASGYIITVFDDYDIFPRKPRRSLGVNYIDYDKGFEKLPPYIGNLQAVYATNTTSASASFVLAPTVVAMSDGATITDYLWEVNDGTITVGSATTQNITVSFPAGHRWVHFTVTDSNSVQHTIHFEVYVGDLITAAFTLHGAETLQWSGTFDGWNGTAPMFADVASINDNQRLTICVLDTNNSVAGAINTNIAVIGRYRRENTRTAGGDSQRRNLQDSDLSIEGFGSSLSNIPVPKFNVTDKATPTVWNDIIDPSPVRLAWHILTRYTTAATIQSFDILTSDLVYKAGALAVSSQGCLSAINQVLARYNARCTFSADGTLRIRRDSNFITSRGGLIIIANITTEDIIDYQYNTEYNDTVGQVTGGGLQYNPATGDYTFLIAKAPTITSTIGEEVQQLNGQILDSTDTDTAAATDLQNRSASKLAQGRVVNTLTLDLFDSWRFLEPSNYDRYNATIPATFNLRGKALDNTIYQQLRSISCNANIKEGTIVPRAVFVEETSAGTAGRVVSVVPSASDVDIPLYPVMQPYSGAFNVDGFLFNPEDFASNEDWEITPEAYQVNNPLDANAIKVLPQAGRGIYVVWLASSTTVTTSFNTVNGETYIINVAGDGVILEQSTPTVITMLNGNGQGDSIPSSQSIGTPTPDVVPGIYDAVNDRYNDKAASIGGLGGNAEITITPGYVSRMIAHWRGTNSFGGTIAGNKSCNLHLDGVSGPGFSWPFGSFTDRLETLDVLEGTHFFKSGNTTNIAVSNYLDRPRNGGNYTRLIRLDIYVTTDVEFRGDAFYKNYNQGDVEAYAGSNGLQVNGAVVSPTPAYNSSHSYEFTITGDGNPITFKYQDSDYNDNDWLPLIITVRGSGAK
jgi:hypothetical protein